MPQTKMVCFGPTALTTTYTTNVLNPGTTTGGVGMPSGSGNLFYVLRHFRIINKTNAAHTFRLYKGATGANAAGSEVVGFDTQVPANSYIEWNGAMRLDVADFLVGGADASSALVFQGEGEIGVA